MKKIFGGEYLNKKAKSKRPLDFSKPHHLVLRLKQNLPSLFDPRDKVLRLGFNSVATKHGIKLYQLVFNHSHVHVIVSIPSRESYVAFIREVTSKSVLYFTKKWKCKFKGIFANRPFTRIASWGKRSMQILNNYMRKNEKESGYKQLRCNLERLCKKHQSGCHHQFKQHLSSQYPSGQHQSRQLVLFLYENLGCE